MLLILLPSITMASLRAAGLPDPSIRVPLRISKVFFPAFAVALMMPSYFMPSYFGLHYSTLPERTLQPQQLARVAGEDHRLGVVADGRGLDEGGAVQIGMERPVDREHEPLDPDLLDRAGERGVGELSAGGEMEVLPDGLAKGSSLHLPRHIAVDARQQEGQSLAEMPQNDLQPRKDVENLAEHQTDRGGGHLAGEAVPDPHHRGVAGIIGVDHVRMRGRRMQVDRHVEALGGIEDPPA